MYELLTGTNGNFPGFLAAAACMGLSEPYDADPLTPPWYRLLPYSISR